MILIMAVILVARVAVRIISKNADRTCSVARYYTEEFMSIILDPIAILSGRWLC